jgi:methionine synthase II (cobalamin-independent)
MTIPTEPIGSIPRPQKLITAFAQYERGSLSQEEFESICQYFSSIATVEQDHRRVKKPGGPNTPD